MTLRDLGYRPYEGARLPPSINWWVMLRQGLARAWGSWMVKLAVLLCIVPSLFIAAYAGLGRFFTGQIGMSAEELPEDAIFEAITLLRMTFTAQTWAFVSLVTAGAGATAIAEDFTFKAFQFYFAKPVTQAQYTVGRVLAVAVFVLLVTLVPVLFVETVLVFSAPAILVEQLGLLLPIIVHALLVSLVMATLSVAVSSLSPSRALTLSAWLFLFLVPHVVAAVVHGIASIDDGPGWPWLYLTSFTGLLGIVADELFKAQGEEPLLHWYFAVPVLLAYVAGAVGLISYRLRRAEVFG
jgi:ABC-type transport system involved in multi-copper enzyme maturation permease subunit